MELTEVKKIKVNNCGRLGIYLRWLNSFNMPDFWLFDVNNTEILLIEKGEMYQLNTTDFKDTSKYQQIFTAKQIKINFDTESKNQGGFEDLFKSRSVNIYQQIKNLDGLLTYKFLPCFVNLDSFEKMLYQDRVKFSFTIEIKEYE